MHRKRDRGRAEPYSRGTWNLSWGSGSFVRFVGRPGDAAIIEIQSDAVTVVREFLAIDDLSKQRGFIFQRSDLCCVSSLPRAAGNHAGTVSANVIRISHFGLSLIMRVGQVHNNRHW